MSGFVLNAVLNADWVSYTDIDLVPTILVSVMSSIVYFKTGSSFSAGNIPYGYG